MTVAVTNRRLAELEETIGRGLETFVERGSGMSNAALAAHQSASRVYAIEGLGTGLIKLGRAVDPAKRLRELQIGSPVPLRLLCSTPEAQGRTEADLHRLFSSRRAHGEWFRLCDDDAAAAVLGYGEFA